MIDERGDAPGVVVGYDGSPGADLALSWALRTGELTGAEVRIVVAAMSATDLPRRLRDYEEVLAQCAASYARDAAKLAENVATTVVVDRGWALPVLLRQAETGSLLVVGSRGHHRVDGAWAGSTSQHLAGRVRCPVVVVRRQQDPAARRILVGVDGSPSSVRALAFAAERAAITGESVLAVHAYPPYSPLGGEMGVSVEEIDAVEHQAAKRLTSDLVAGIALDHPAVSLTPMAVMGRPARVLARLSEDSSLVVVGSRGRTPVQELVLGSVAMEVLNRALCPVGVVR